MESHTFWLISILNHHLSVSLIDAVGGTQVKSTGPIENWDGQDSISLKTSVDKSLSQAAASADLASDMEPSTTAFVVPPFWVNSDSRIIPDKLKLLEDLCRSLQLKPLGFIASDEAIVEEANNQDGFPASFVLVQSQEEQFILSLAYLGKIHTRLRKSLSTPLTPADVESALVEINSQSTLPPQIILWGQVDKSTISHFRDYPWIGKKDTETFLHLPEIIHKSDPEIIAIFARAVAPQVSNDETPSKSPSAVASPSSENAPDASKKPIAEPVPVLEAEEEKEEDFVPVDEVTPQDLGFTLEEEPPSSAPQPQLPLESDTIAPSPSTSHPPRRLPQIKIRLPSIPIGRLFSGLFSRRFALVPLIFLPLLLLSPLLLSRVNLILFVTPYQFQAQADVKLDSLAGEYQTGDSVIPVSQKVFEISKQVSTPTTGTKTIGEKAKGQITIFNKLDTSQTLPQGTTLTDKDGHRFRLTTSVTIAASNSDLDLGVITLGQTKAVAEAADIGPEYNIGTDTELKFEDHSSTSLVAKVQEAFSGGSRQQISAVAQEDQQLLQDQAKSSIEEEISQKIGSEVEGLPGLIPGATFSYQKKIDFSREVGEPADELTATLEATVTAYLIDLKVKEKAINSFFANETDFSQAVIDPDLFTFQFTPTSHDQSSASGSLKISGQALPRLDTQKLIRDLSIKPSSRVSQLVRQLNNRIYDYNLQISPTFLKGYPFLPYPESSYHVEMKVENT